jgi:uncharacterized protein (TIGR02246 family)
VLTTARANFKRWNDALQTKDPLAVANMYSTSELSFLPTVSPQHIKGLPSTEDYFKDFVLKNPFGTITDDSVQVFDGGNAYLHSGMYTFELGDAGARTPVEARFSYVWRSYNGDWKITHHHSSVTPAAPDKKQQVGLGRIPLPCQNSARVSSASPDGSCVNFSETTPPFLHTSGGEVEMHTVEKEAQGNRELEVRAVPSLCSLFCSQRRHEICM